MSRAASAKHRREELTPGTVRGEFFTRLDNGKFRCEVCPRYCTLKSGQRAFCFVRAADDEGVVLTSYGRSTGFCIDPIEKKPLNHFYPGTSILSFGTAGCNLGCRFCQNWDISKAREIEKLSSRAYPEDIANAAKQAGCDSVAFTYNDPVIFLEYAIDAADACREQGIHPVAVSAGYMTDVSRPKFYQHMDAANIDLKAFTQEFYHKVCFADLQPVLDTLIYLKHETKVWFEVTTLLIPDENDSDAELHQLTDWFAEHLGPDVPLHFTAFHPDFKMLDKPHTPATTLQRARDIAMSKGLHYVFTGNVHDRSGQSTFCPSCKALVIERDWYRLGHYDIKDGKCGQCGCAISGHFNNTRGNWGARRTPLQIIGG